MRSRPPQHVVGADHHDGTVLDKACIEGEDRGKLHLFVATFGYSRRVYVRAFRHFGGVLAEPT